MPDFWGSSGHHLLERTSDGRLKVTDAFFRAYLDRPELHPIETSCAAECGLHADLIDDPRQAVAAERLSTLADPEARENYRLFLTFRDRLARHSSIEAFYLDMVLVGSQSIPPLFIDHLVQVILRTVLQDCSEPLQVRAAELFFRSQKVTIVDAAIMMADEETIDMRAARRRSESGETLIASESDPGRVEMDVLGPHNAHSYWARSDRFDTVFDASLVHFGQDALARVLEAWVKHLLGVDVGIQPVASIRDQRWRWHVGLDAEASGILNDLYAGRAVDEVRLARILALFRLEFKDPTVALPDMTDRPVYLGMAMTADGRLRLKPQNLLVNLPLAHAA
jgi:hypothetical protein